MAGYVGSLGLKVVRIDTATIPRDAITIFEKPAIVPGRVAPGDCSPGASSTR